MLKVKDLTPREKKMVFAETCAQLRSEPSALNSLNEEERKLMFFILGETWAELVQTLSVKDLEDEFHNQVPECPDTRLLNRPLF